jgi:hypothetical protein
MSAIGLPAGKDGRVSYAAEAPPSILAAFPPQRARDVATVEDAMPAASFGPLGAFTVVVDADEVTIPYRIYNPEPDPAVEEALSPVQRTLLACLYTRHHDGRIRERRLTDVIASDADWVVPYVVYLASEYVVEIAVLVHAGLGSLTAGDPRRGTYQRFIKANQGFMDLMEARAMSYWSCYYRARFPRRATSPNRDDYPGLAVVRMLRSLGDAESAPPG